MQEIENKKRKQKEHRDKVQFDRKNRDILVPFKGST